MRSKSENRKTGLHERGAQVEQSAPAPAQEPRAPEAGDALASLTIFLSARERARAIATLGRLHTDRTRAFLRLLDGAARGAKA